MRLPQKFLAIIVVATTTLVYGAHRSHGQGARADAEMLANRAPAKESIRRALLVGVNIYQPNTAATPARGKSRGYWYNLDGPTNDVDELREILIARYDFKPDHIHVLKDSEATRDRILAELRKQLIDEAAPGDVGLFFYAGHGSQVFNSKSTEADKKDESLVPADSAQGAMDIRDKELARLFNQSLDKGVLLTVIVDSCHSGSIARGYPVPEKPRFLEPDLRDVADPPDPGKTPGQRGALIFSAARDDQSALEKKDDQGVAHGIFSRALLQTLRSVPLTEPADRIYLRVKALMQTEGVTQEPILESSEERMRKSLFGSEPGELSSRTVVAVLKVGENSDLELQGGKAVGLAEGCELKKVGLPAEGAVRIQVTQVDGLNRCKAKVIEGDSKAVRTGDLFEVDRWIAPDEAILRVWIPPATLAYADLLNTARELSTLRTSAKVVWIDDPTEIPEGKTTKQVASPLQVVSWEGTEWQLFLPGRRIVKLGKNPTAVMVLDKLRAGGVVKPRLFVHIPPPLELSKELKLGSETQNNSIHVVAAPEQADYLLMGRIRDKDVQYAWGLPNITKSLGSNLPLPIRTDWLTASETPESVMKMATELETYILRIGRVKAWLRIEAPPDANPFPYHLALKNVKTGEINTSGKTFKAEEYNLTLIADRARLAKRPVTPRYVYLFTIDSSGKSELLFGADTENCVSCNVAGQGIVSVPTEIQLSRIEVVEPFGIDTFILITSIDAIPNAREALTFDGVRTRGQVAERRDGLSPLAKLLYQTGAATRGDKLTNPVGWSIQRLSVKSEPQRRK